MNHGSLFSGIGGFDLAAEWMGWENKFHCEWNPFGQKILKHYWPNATSYTDITKTDFSVHRGQIDILSGGFPCQPYSVAGKRKGKEDERHLWPEMLRAVREIQPGWVVGENVSGLVNWSGGLVFHEVQTELETQGYEVQPFILPACGINAPHKRDRVWFIAYTNDKGLQGGAKTGNITSGRTGVYQQPERFFNGSGWGNFPVESPVCSGNDGISGRLDGITFPEWRKESIKAGGNAIVPQVAHQIFKAIEQYQTHSK